MAYTMSKKTLEMLTDILPAITRGGITTRDLTEEQIDALDDLHESLNEFFNN